MSGNFWPALVGAYLLGSVPSAYLAGKWSRGIDIRQYGSGNVGATNLLRFTSKRVALPVIIFDSAKGMIMLAVTASILHLADSASPTSASSTSPFLV